MTVYPCPRSDLACAERFLSTGDLDYHLHVTHGYRGVWRIVASLRPDHPLPIGPRPARHVPDGLVEGQGTPTLAESHDADSRADAGKADAGKADAGKADAGALTGIRPSATVAAGHRSRRHVRISR
ncbi:hypothetical protein [Frankia sp. ACN1ag]|uniref:hypothetical protein n=1 Tax=Frankia sp. ACN1ag TaxID=102891 RepID=UPI000A74BBEE|nr:hypothetical protein [Frankia sp. ACN1ag]